MEGCEEDTAAKGMYRTAQTTFKIGCRGCNRKKFAHALCDNCEVKALQVNTSEIEHAINTAREHIYPFKVRDDVDMPNDGKHTLENRTSDDGLEKTRNSAKGSA